MPGNINSQIAQLLNQTPNLRATCAYLRCDFCSAHDDRGVSDEKTDNASQPGVSLCRSLLWQGHSCSRPPFWQRLLDAGIMRDGPRNSNRFAKNKTQPAVV